jgi:hypothetical protein
MVSSGSAHASGTEYDDLLASLRLERSWALGAVAGHQPPAAAAERPWASVLDSIEQQVERHGLSRRCPASATPS